MQFLTGISPNMTPEFLDGGATKKEFADFLTSRSFTITPGDIKSISINSWFLCLLMIKSVQP